MSLDFLNTFLGGEKVAIPVGGDFSPMGLIGRWSGKVLYSTSYTEIDLSAHEGVVFLEKVKANASDKWRYYFETPDAAKPALDVIGANRTDAVWRIGAPKSSILNFRDTEVASKFGENIVYEVNIKTPKSAKYRHEFQLLALPYAVQALALVSGQLKEAIFNANELQMPDREGDPDRFTDAYQAEMIGDPDGGIEGMIESTLGKRRVALWKALGESDPLAYVTEGKKYVATSPVLKQMLSIVETAWTAPIWGEMLNLYDPRVDAAYSNQNGERVRPRVTVLSRIFENESAARAEAQRQLAENASKNAAAPAAAGSNGNGNGEPKLPHEWVDIPDEWKAEIKKYAESGKPNALIAKTLSAETADVDAWRAYLKV